MMQCRYTEYVSYKWNAFLNTNKFKSFKSKTTETLNFNNISITPIQRNITVGYVFYNII